MDMNEKIRNHSLLNAIKHKGKAAAGSVIGSLIAENPEIKNQLKEISRSVAQIINDVNKLSPEEQENELRANAPDMLLEKPNLEEEKVLKPLPNAVKGKVVMRFEPSPSGPLHIGHAFVGSLNAEYCRMYDGKFIVRISDTNSDNIYPSAYEQIVDDAEWLWKRTAPKFETYVQSDRMETYYEYAEKLIEKDAVYICTCKQEDFKELITNKKACPCRPLAKKEQMTRWKKMLDKSAKGYNEGDAVMRFKSSVDDKNPAMRDFPLIRINQTPHPRQGEKYKVWPLMNFSVAIDDLTTGITHSIRGKDHFDNEKRQRMIFKALGEEKKMPVALFVGRINFEGFEVSCSKTKVKIEEGIYSGWDDIRIPFIPALKRRGYLHEAFMKYAVDVGVSLNDKSVHIDEFFKTLNSFNKDFLDPIAKRFFFIPNPKTITIEGAHKSDVELDIHPDNQKGGRKFSTSGKFYITGDDLSRIKKLRDGDLIRLMDCLNFVKKGEKLIFDSKDYEKYKEKGKMIIHWLPADEKQVFDAEVLMPDKEKVTGKIERSIATQLLVDDNCQLERFGFARLDAIDTLHNKYLFWLTHK